MNAEQTTALERRAAVHAALADPHRLAIVDELCLSDRSPTELRWALEIGSNLLAYHLDALERAGLIERLASAGDGRRKYLRLVPNVLERTRLPADAIPASRVLFVCTGNSARSQLAAALWNRTHEVPAESAGTRPAPRVHPLAVRAGAKAGLDLSAAAPRGLEQVPGTPELVVTVCDRAYEELGELREARVLHWSIPDPAEAGVASAFDDTVRRLDARIRTLAPLVRRRRARTPRRTHP